MKRKLIALAVATAFAAPAVMAEVTIYGKVHMSLENIATDNSTADVDKFTVNSNASRLGFKGSEDLGNGLNAIFKYEMTYAVDGASTSSSFTTAADGTVTETSTATTGNSITSGRNAYLGLAGDFGTVLVGRHDTPAKMAYYAAGNDHLDGTVADLNDTVGFTESRVNNAIAYISPKMSGMQIAAAVTPGEQSGASASTDANGLMDTYSIGLMYAGGGLKAGLGYEQVADTSTINSVANAVNNEVKTFQMGASYTMDAFTIGAQYGKNDNVNNNIVTVAGVDTLVDGIKSTNMAVSGKYQMGNNAIMANYGKGEVETNIAGTINEAKTTYTGIGFQHNMSKRTNVYVAYSNADQDSGSTVDQIGVGIVHSF